MYLNIYGFTTLTLSHTSSISCAQTLHASSGPLYVPAKSFKLDENHDDNHMAERKISLVLPLCTKDIPRARILLESLRQLKQSLVYIFYIIVPDSQQKIIESQLADGFLALSFQSKTVKVG